MQSSLAGVLDTAGIKFQREVRLAPGDIVDFLIEGGVAIECKLKGQKMKIYKQLVRYAGSDKVNELILVTNTSMGLPTTIGGKPTYYCSLGEAWL